MGTRKGKSGWGSSDGLGDKLLGAVGDPVVGSGLESPGQHLSLHSVAP